MASLFPRCTWKFLRIDFVLLIRTLTPLPEFLFFKTLQAEACNFIKKKNLAQVLSCEFCEILKTPVLQNTSGRLLLLTNLQFSKCLGKTLDIMQIITLNDLFRETKYLQ